MSDCFRLFVIPIFCYAFRLSLRKNYFMRTLKLIVLFVLNGLFCYATASEISELQQGNIPKELLIFVKHDELWGYEYHDLDDDGDTDVLLITKPKKIKLPTAKNNLVLSILEKKKDGRLRKVAENKEIFSYLEMPKHLFSGEDIFKFQKNQFSIYQEKHAGTLNNNTYTFRKFKNGLWYLTGVENVRTINNQNTGEIDVVTDFKKYPRDFKKIRFDQFNPDLLSNF